MCRGHGWWLFAVGVLLLFGLFGPGAWLFGGMGGMMGRYWGPGYGYGPSAGWYMPFVGLFFIFLVAAGIFLLVRLFSRRDYGSHAQHLDGPMMHGCMGGMHSMDGMDGHSTAAGETPLEIVKKRYARGEITKEEFDTIRRDLQ